MRAEQHAAANALPICVQTGEHMVVSLWPKRMGPNEWADDPLATKVSALCEQDAAPFKLSKVKVVRAGGRLGSGPKSEHNPAQDDHTDEPGDDRALDSSQRSRELADAVGHGEDARFKGRLNAQLDIHRTQRQEQTRARCAP